MQALPSSARERSPPSCAPPERPSMALAWPAPRLPSSLASTPTQTSRASKYTIWPITLEPSASISPGIPTAPTAMEKRSKAAKAGFSPSVPASAPSGAGRNPISSLPANRPKTQSHHTLRAHVHRRVRQACGRIPHRPLATAYNLDQEGLGGSGAFFSFVALRKQRMERVGAHNYSSLARHRIHACSSIIAK